MVTAKRPKAKTCAFKRKDGSRCRNKAALKYGGYCHMHAWAGGKALALAAGKMLLDVAKTVAAEEIVRHVVMGRGSKTGTTPAGKRTVVKGVTRCRPEHIRRGATVKASARTHSARAQRRPTTR